MSRHHRKAIYLTPTIYIEAFHRDQKSWWKVTSLTHSYWKDHAERADWFTAEVGSPVHYIGLSILKQSIRDNAEMQSVFDADVRDFEEAQKIAKGTSKLDPVAVDIITAWKQIKDDRNNLHRSMMIPTLEVFYTQTGKTGKTRANYELNLKPALEAFLRIKMSANDIHLDTVDDKFIHRFELWLTTTYSRHGKPYSKSTARQYVKLLRVYLQWAYNMGEMKLNPLERYVQSNLLDEDKGERKKRIEIGTLWHIRPEDLIKIESFEMAQDMNYGTMHRMDLNVKNTQDVDLPLLRKVFLWQTWTGMSYADLVAYDDVRRTVLQKDFSGRDSLIYNRAKNGELAIVIFFDEARKILDSLEGRVNPRCSYSTYNRGIKRILNYYGIETDKASTHLGRHLFGCRMLMKGMSIESISRMMGHTSISQTEKVYAKIDLGTIQADWDRIKQNEKIGTDIAV